MLLLSCPYSPCEHVAGAFDERLFRGQISLVVDLFNLRRNGDLRSPPAKPTGAGTTPIPGGTGPDPLSDLPVVTRSTGVR